MGRLRNTGRLRSGSNSGPSSLFAGGGPGMWLDASDLSTMFQDTAGTTPVTATGQSVALLRDKSGNGNHRTQATVAKRPVLQQDGTGRYYLDHTAATDQCLSGAISGLTTGMTSSVAYKSALSTNSHVVGTRVPADNYFGIRVSGDTSNPTGQNVGSSFAALINGVSNYPNTRDGLYVKTAANLLVEEDLNLDLTAWLLFSYGGYGGGFSFGGRFYGGIIYKPRNGSSIATARSYLAGKSGAVPGTYAGGIGYAIGDSTVAAYLGQNSVTDYVTGSTYVTYNQAVPGDTIAGQRTIWEAGNSSTYARWVIIEVGLNDLDPAEAASVTLARLQALVNVVRAGVPSGAKVLVAQLTPCRQRLIDLYGATNGPISYQKWLDVNSAIAGSGSTPITNVDGRVTAHVPLLNDGSGNLAAIYDMGDHIHENNAARQIIGQAWADGLTAVGAL